MSTFRIATKKGENRKYAKYLPEWLLQFQLLTPTTTSSVRIPAVTYILRSTYYVVKSYTTGVLIRGTLYSR